MLYIREHGKAQTKVGSGVGRGPPQHRRSLPTESGAPGTRGISGGQRRSEARCQTSDRHHLSHLTFCHLSSHLTTMLAPGLPILSLVERLHCRWSLGTDARPDITGTRLAARLGDLDRPPRPACRASSVLAHCAAVRHTQARSRPTPASVCPWSSAAPARASRSVGGLSGQCC